MRQQALDMLPILALDNAPDSGPPHREMASDGRQGHTFCVHSPHFNHISGHDLRRAGILPFQIGETPPSTSFGLPIRDIDGSRTWEKVVRVHARRIIALMKRKIRAKRPIFDFTCDTVGKYGFVVVGYNAIPTRVYGATPRPALVWGQGWNLTPVLANDATKGLNPSRALKYNSALAAWFVCKPHAVDNGILGFLRQDWRGDG